MQTAKNKRTTYLLICAVAVVWGIILYKIFFKATDSDDQIKTGVVKVTREPYDQYVAKPDTFKLVLNYRDPFIGTPVAAEKKMDNQIVKPVSPVINLPPPINWGTIQYTGRIINPVSKKVVSILSVNGAERMMSEGEIFQGVKLLKNKRDSILISWQGKQKYIKQ